MNYMEIKRSEELLYDMVESQIKPYIHKLMVLAQEGTGEEADAIVGKAGAHLTECQYKLGTTLSWARVIQVKKESTAD